MKQHRRTQAVVLGLFSQSATSGMRVACGFCSEQRTTGPRTSGGGGKRCQAEPKLGFPT
jgi:hypothetical protein